MNLQLERIEGVRKIKDITGNIFGRLTALSFAFRKNKVTYWLCECTCGKEKVVSAKQLLNGKTKSCGCLRVEMNSSHKLSAHPLYQTYMSMIKRCYDDKSISYKYYGKLGITVCDEWRNNISSFIEWSMNNGYCKELVLDREKNNLGYTPENCRWVTVIQNNRNKKNNLVIERSGLKKTLIEWCEELQLPYNTIEKRILGGWSIEKALIIPIRNKRKTHAAS